MLARWLPHLLAVILALGAWPALAGNLTPQGEKLIIDFEVGGQSVYVSKYQKPICPACLTTDSGVTIGIGYDLRHQTYNSVMQDWKHHPHLPRLLQAQGLQGAEAVAMARSMRDVVTPWPMAIQNFRELGIIPYGNLALRIFGPNFSRLTPWAQDALKSLVYNRGGSMVGPARLEMRFIRDVCVNLWRAPYEANNCIARQLRKMPRIWEGGSIYAGMLRRRNAEAVLALYSPGV